METYKPEEGGAKEEIRYKGKLFEVISEPVEIEGKTFAFERVRRSPGVRLIVGDRQGNILLTREFRRELSKFDYRLPGGKVFDSLDEFNAFKQSGGDIIEKSRQAAFKEAKEETGFVPDILEYYSTSKLGATVEWDLHYFTGSVDRSQQALQELESGENIEVVWASEEEAGRLVLEADKFSEERSVATLMRFLHHSEARAQPQEQEGSRLASLLESEDISSVRVRTKNIERLNQISSVIVVGSSLVGKTTLVDALRRAMKTSEELASVFQIPKRIITRPQRANDNLVENQFVTTTEFDEMVRQGDIGMHWVRKMEGDREEQYGFLGGDKSRIPIFSGNNAIINNKRSIVPPDLLEHSLVIAVYSPDDLRDERMKQRSPDLIKDKPKEASHRLSDRAINMYPEAHLVVKNFGHYESLVKEDIVTLFSLIAKMKS